MLLLKKVLGVPAPDQVSGLYAPNTLFFSLDGNGDYFNIYLSTSDGAALRSISAGALGEASMVAWWNSFNNINGKSIGLITPSFGRFTELEVSGDATFGGVMLTEGGMLSPGGGGLASNFAAGEDALAVNTTGTENTAVGTDALSANTTGIQNTAVGNSALKANVSGTYNTALGAGALRTNTTGNFNVALGYSSLNHNVDGAHNVAVGYGSLYSTTSGIQNTAVGHNAL